MKRIFITFLILLPAIAVFCSLRATQARDQQTLAKDNARWQAQIQQTAALQLKYQQFSEHLGETRRRLEAQPAVPPLQQLQDKILSGDSLRELSAAEREQLLAELELNWNTTGDYLVISKKSLDNISFSPLHGAKLTRAAIETFALTPAEQDAVNTLAAQTAATQAAWARDHVQRTEPGGNVVAQYSLPVDQDFSQNQLATFTNGITGILGEQRAGMFQNEAQQWMQDAGLLTGPDTSRIPAEFQGIMSTMNLQTQPTTLTVTRYPSGDDVNLGFQLQQAGGSMSATVNPWQSFPAAFQGVFPGGWTELAQREGFELPKSFGSH